MKNYKMRVTPEQSRAVQEACFAKGIYWAAGNDRVLNKNKPYLYITAFDKNSTRITYGYDEDIFERRFGILIEPEDFIAMLNNTTPREKPMTAHPNAELMLQYAQDAAETNRPWERWQFFSRNFEEWLDCEDHPYWGDREYRRKPETIKVGRHEFPRPMREALENEADYWLVDFFTEKKIAAVRCLTWTGCSLDFAHLKSNRCHLTEEAAEQHAAVLNAINRGDV